MVEFRVHLSLVSGLMSPYLCPVNFKSPAFERRSDPTFLSKVSSTKCLTQTSDPHKFMSGSHGDGSSSVRYVVHLVYKFVDGVDKIPVQTVDVRIVPWI